MPAWLGKERKVCASGGGMAKIITARRSIDRTRVLWSGYHICPLSPPPTLNDCGRYGCLNVRCYSARWPHQVYPIDNHYDRPTYRYKQYVCCYYRRALGNETARNTYHNGRLEKLRFYLNKWVPVILSTGIYPTVYFEVNKYLYLKYPPAI